MYNLATMCRFACVMPIFRFYVHVFIVKFVISFLPRNVVFQKSMQSNQTRVHPTKCRAATGPDRFLNARVYALRV